VCCQGGQRYVAPAKVVRCAVASKGPSISLAAGECSLCLWLSAVAFRAAAGLCVCSVQCFSLVSEGRWVSVRIAPIHLVSVRLRSDPQVVVVVVVVVVCHCCHGARSLPFG